jgi:hypothetical protein
VARTCARGGEEERPRVNDAREAVHLPSGATRSRDAATQSASRLRGLTRPARSSARAAAPDGSRHGAKGCPGRLIWMRAAISDLMSWCLSCSNRFFLHAKSTKGVDIDFKAAGKCQFFEIMFAGFKELCVQGLKIKILRPSVFSEQF